MSTHSSILAWRIPWGRKEFDTTERLSLSLADLKIHAWFTMIRPGVVFFAIILFSVLFIFKKVTLTDRKIHLYRTCCSVLSRSVISDSLRPCGL